MTDQHRCAAMADEDDRGPSAQGSEACLLVAQLLHRHPLGCDAGEIMRSTALPATVVAKALQGLKARDLVVPCGPRHAVVWRTTHHERNQQAALDEKASADEALLQAMAMRVADQAVVAMVECEGTVERRAGVQWLDVGALLDERENAPQVIDLNRLWLDYALMRGLIARHPDRAALVRVVRQG